jgi:hypothetical protein
MEVEICSVVLVNHLAQGNQEVLAIAPCEEASTLWVGGRRRGEAQSERGGGGAGG